MKVLPATPGLGKLILSCALAASMSATLVACGDDDDAGPTVDTNAGRVVGSESPTARQFLGIPYAAPPVGDLRWRAPAAVKAWSGDRDATTLAAHCAQPASRYGVETYTEDCLYLNVYTPTTPGPHPVMVWFHGGAFYVGQSDAYKPTALVAQNTIVVTVNYRLGAFGFLSHPALTAEQGGSSGNYGLMDQQAALKWVQDNIARFGGDKANVTIFGESAGGFSVNAHLAAPGSAGLFHKAIAMSGAYPFGALGQPTLAAAETAGGSVATAAGCTAPATAACLRGLSTKALVDAMFKTYPSGPIPSVDGSVLKTSVAAAFTAGTQAKVPVIQGSTRDEWRLFVAAKELDDKKALDATTFASYVSDNLGGAQVLALANAFYPIAKYGNSHSLTAGALGTDLVFSCNSRLATRMLTAGGNSVFAYEFNDPTAPQTLPGTLSFSTGSAHTSELQYLFSMGGTPLTAAQQTLSAAIVGYWSRFARTGNPSGGTAPAWPAYTLAGDAFQNLAPTIGSLTTFSVDHNCTTLWTRGI